MRGHVTNVVCVDDCAAFGLALVRALGECNCFVSHEPTVAGAIRRLSEEACDMLLLDWIMPDISGVDAIQAFRELRRDLPIIVLTVAEELCDRLAAFNAGADDYVLKSTHLEELRARVRALLRRRSHTIPAPEMQSEGDPMPVNMACGALQLDFRSQRVTMSGVTARVTPSEFRFLLALVDAKGRFLAEKEVASATFEVRPSDIHNSIKVLASRVRGKLRGMPVAIVTKDRA